MKLITKAIETKLAKSPLYSTEGTPKAEKKIICKFFFGAYTWYVVEAEKQSDGDYLFFGIVDYLGQNEMGYFTLSELQSLRHWGIPCVERDMYFKPCKFSEVA